MEEKKNSADRKKNRKLYLLVPVLIFILAFILDKQFFIWRFPDYFLRTASFVSYEHKVDLLSELEFYIKRPSHKKVVVIFGNSRTTHFDNAYIAKKFPKFILYNFSVPGGTPDYYLYMMEKFQKKKIKPSFIFFAITPQGFHDNPSIAMDEVMLEGLSPSFVARYALNYKVDHITNYIAKKLFWTYQYRPKLRTIRKRLKNNSRATRIFRLFLAREKMHLVNQRGSIPLPFHGKPTQDKDFLKHTADGTWRDFLENFKVNKGQIDFLKRTLKLSQSMNIPNAMLWVKVGPNLRRYKATRKVVKVNHTRITIKDFFVPLCQNLATRYQSSFVDMNYSIQSQCEYFSDSSHMAPYCFPEFTDLMFQHTLIK